jgi:nitrous oxidase accessory protein
MAVSMIIPISATTLSEKSSLIRGNTLYVGGSGSNNYTKIQDAINASSNGDTVFVYHDSSPYYENLVVSKSIYLLGEEKNITIIDGSRKGDVISVKADGVTISGFSIINGENSIGCNKAGIKIIANDTTIFNNIATNNFFGIVSILSGNIIRNNIIHSNSWGGIWLSLTRNSSVDNNIIYYNYACGIQMNNAFHNSIVGNTLIKNNDNGSVGLVMVDSDNNEISNNNVTNNAYHGILLYNSKNNVISQNNFIDNGKSNAIFVSLIKRIGRNSWDGNYWDNSRQNIYPIFGRIAITQILEIGIIPWFQFDWHPAQQPYNIP